MSTSITEHLDDFKMAIGDCMRKSCSTEATISIDVQIGRLPRELKDKIFEVREICHHSMRIRNRRESN